MGRKKQMIKRMVENLRIKKRQWAEEEKESFKEKEITPEEHKKRLEYLKSLGIIKE